MTPSPEPRTTSVFWKEEREVKHLITLAFIAHAYSLIDSHIYTRRGLNVQIGCWTHDVLTRVKLILYGSMLNILSKILYDM